MSTPNESKRVWQTRSWEDNWNSVMRRVLFKDEMLLQMMMIPPSDQSNILNFISKYFIRDSISDTQMINENARVIYSEIEGAAMNIPQMKRRYLAFDIYVKSTEQHSFDRDKLKYRHLLIAQRIRYLLTRHQCVEGMRFSIVDEFELGSRVVGYDRYHLVMEYKKTY